MNLSSGPGRGQSTAPSFLKKLRRIDINEKFVGLNEDKSTIVVELYLMWLKSIRKQSPKADTARQYAEIVERLSHRFAELIEDKGDQIRPILLVRELCWHGRSVGRTTWATYRAAFLWHFLAIRERSSASELVELDLALAILIGTDQSPENDERDGDQRGPVRAESLNIKCCDVLAVRLAQGSPASRRALTFMRVTLITGLRPSEWVGVVFRPAVANDLPADHDAGPWDVLEIRTGKGKQGQPERHRTLLLDRLAHGNLIAIHLANIAAVVAIDGASRKIDPLRRFIKTSSTTIGRCCDDLWPKRADRHACLYTFRSQARANFAKWFGDLEASEMLGHDASTGPRYYALKSKGHLAGNVTVRPGLDVLERAGNARVIRLKQASNVDKPWSSARTNDALSEFDAPAA